MTSTESPRRRLSAPERRALIVDAALAEFSEHGYENASLGTIARRAGITRTVLYGHFASKRALFVALLDAKQDELMAQLRDALADDRSTGERMRAALEAWVGFAEREPEAWRLLFPDHAPVDPEVAADHRRRQAAANRLMAGMLAPDAERAGLDPRSPQARAIFALQQAALQGIVRWWFAHPSVTREQVIDAALRSLWLGVQGMEQAPRRA